MSVRSHDTHGLYEVGEHSAAVGCHEEPQPTLLWRLQLAPQMNPIIKMMQMPFEGESFSLVWFSPQTQASDADVAAE